MYVPFWLTFLTYIHTHTSGIVYVVHGIFANSLCSATMHFYLFEQLLFTLFYQKPRITTPKKPNKVFHMQPRRYTYMFDEHCLAYLYLKTVEWNKCVCVCVCIVNFWLHALHLQWKGSSITSVYIPWVPWIELWSDLIRIVKHQNIEHLVFFRCRPKNFLMQ